jgi:uncharacterized protein
MTDTPIYRRREFIGIGVGGVAAVSLGAVFWDDLFGSSEEITSGRTYGPRHRPDRNGIRLPEGFRARLVAQGGERVNGTGYVWHTDSDGAATFPTGDGGWILVSNSEVDAKDEGGASAIRFAEDGSVADAYRILEGTQKNCSGGGTPWGTWLSCEEVSEGRVWECDPTGRGEPIARPAMGVFQHEAAAVDPAGKRIYLTEDQPDGGFYRFTPERWQDLSSGELEIATVESGGKVVWTRLPDPAAREDETRFQVEGSTRFENGEGIWRDAGVVYIATTGDHRVHAYDIRSERIKVIHDGRASPRSPLRNPDQMTASRAGELFVCEDSEEEEMDIVLITPAHRASKFVSVTGPQHEGSELTGVAFNPSGGRMYFASQRARETGAVYEVAGPFNGVRTA